MGTTRAAEEVGASKALVLSSRPRLTFISSLSRASVSTCYGSGRAQVLLRKPQLCGTQAQWDEADRTLC